MLTLSDLTAATGFAVLDHLEAELEVPILDGLQAQGDLIFVPQPHIPVKETAGGLIPPAGVAVISPIGAGHEHRVFASSPGTAWWADAADGQVLGLLTATEPVYSLHAEHGATGLAPGVWELRRQREQAQEERLVAD